MKLRYEPERFQADPLGWLGNQSWRFLGGVFLTVIASAAYFSVFGEYPYKTQMGTTLVILYLAWELLTQRRADGTRDWKDIVDDLLVWTWGVLIVLWPLSEVQATMLTLEPDLSAFWAMVAVLLVHAITGVGVRAVQRCRE